MASQVESTHCCNRECLRNSTGRLNRCPHCGSTEVNYWLVWQCETCGQLYENEQAAIDCHEEGNDGEDG